jgi:hypothetical protein
MIKIRITGLPDEVDSFLNELRELFSVTEESKSYKNTKSKYVRKYVDIEKREEI